MKKSLVVNLFQVQQVYITFMIVYILSLHLSC